MTSVRRLPHSLWRRVRSIFALIRDDRDVREVYGDNPNHLPEDELQDARNARANVIMCP